MAEDGKEDLSGRKFNFLVSNVFLTGSLQECVLIPLIQVCRLIEKLGIGNEETVEIYY